MRRRAAVLLAATALLAVVLLAAVARNPVVPVEPDRNDARGGRDDAGAVDGGGLLPPPEVVEPDDRSGGVLLGVVGTVILLLALIALAAVLTMRRTGRPDERTGGSRDEPGDAATAPVDGRAVAVGVADAAAEFDRLRREGRAGDAVIAAWTRLEALAAEVGSARLDHQTPSEFTEVLVARGLPDAPLAELRRSYHRARFSRHPVDDADGAAAARAVRRIAAAVPAVEVTR